MAQIATGTALGWARLAAIGLLLTVGAVFAQPASAPAARPAFEVASVKLSNEQFFVEIRRVGNGNFTYDHYLRTLIAWAYGVPLDQVVAPDWTLMAHVVIAAKAGRPVSDDQVRLMVQTLLEDRFKLKVHRETKETLVAALSVAGNKAPQLKESPEGQAHHVGYDSGKQQWILTGYTMTQFVDYLAQFYHGAIDRTGLPGRYDFVLDYSHLGDPSNPEALELQGVRIKLMPDALDQIGLKLAAIKTPLEFVVVDQLEKNPTEN